MKKQKEEKKRFPVLPMICGLFLFLLAAAYAGGIYYYRSHFLNGTVIDRVDVSGMTIGELQERIEDYMLRIVERKTDGTAMEEDIQGKDIDLTYASTEPLQEFLETQNIWTWFLPQTAEHKTENLLSYDEKKLETEIRTLKGFQNDFAVAPTDAYISDYTPEKGFEIIAETQGNKLKWQDTLDTIQNAVKSLDEQTDLDKAGCYQVPTVTAEDEQLLKTLDRLQKYAGITITYTFGDNKEILDGGTISNWLHVDGFEVTLDQGQVGEYVAALRKRYDSIFRSRTFQTSYGREITIDGGDYGWWMNYEQETKELTEMIERGESGERTPVYYQTAVSYGTPDYGTTYVEINLTAQHLFFYKEGSLVLESDFVSGNSSRGYDTPAGVYGVTYKQRNATLVGETYQTPVSYWMPFNRNIGMHDATWRGSFGGNIYKTSGSHGCINLPYSIAQQIYEGIEKGTPVICYHLPGTEPAERVMEKGAPPEEETAPEAATAPEAETVPEAVPEAVPAPEEVPGAAAEQ